MTFANIEHNQFALKLVTVFLQETQFDGEVEVNMQINQVILDVLNEVPYILSHSIVLFYTTHS